jgi:hypothetical protein
MGGGKKVLKFEGVKGGGAGVGIQAANLFVSYPDWCIRLRVMPLEGGGKWQTLLCMVQIELRYDVSREQLSLIVYPDPNKGRPVTVLVSLPKDRWSEVVASIKGRELTLRAGEETATLEIPESGVLYNSKAPFRLGRRGSGVSGQDCRPFTGMMSDISFGKPN